MSIAKRKTYFRDAATKIFTAISPPPKVPGKIEEHEPPIQEYVEMESLECFSTTTRSHKRNLLISTSVVFVLTIPGITLTNGFVLSAGQDIKLAIGLLYWVALYEFISFSSYASADYFNWRRKNTAEFLRYHSRFGTNGYAAIQNLPNQVKTLQPHFEGNSVRLRDNFHELLSKTTTLVNEADHFYNIGNQYVTKLAAISHHNNASSFFRIWLIDLLIPAIFFFWMSKRALIDALYSFTKL